MAWTTPMTAVANEIFTAAQYNTYVRDNLLETAPAKAITSSQYFISDGTNLIANTSGSAQVSAGQTTISATYTDLTTIGPTFPRSINVGFIMWVGAQLVNSTATDTSYMSVEITRTSDSSVVFAPSDTVALSQRGTNIMGAASGPHTVTGLAPDIYTFTAKYRTSTATTSTATFGARWLHVIPF